MVFDWTGHPTLSLSAESVRLSLAQAGGHLVITEDSSRHSGPGQLCRSLSPLQCTDVAIMLINLSLSKICWTLSNSVWMVAGHSHCILHHPHLKSLTELNMCTQSGVHNSVQGCSNCCKLIINAISRTGSNHQLSSSWLFIGQLCSNGRLTSWSSQ